MQYHIQMIPGPLDDFQLVRRRFFLNPARIMKFWNCDAATIVGCALLFGLTCGAIARNNLPYLDDYYLREMQKQDGFWAATESFQAMWGYYRLFYTTMMAPTYGFFGDNLWFLRCMGLSMHIASACCLYLVLKQAGYSKASSYIGLALFLFFPYSLEAIAWPANVTQYPLAPMLALSGAALLLSKKTAAGVVCGGMLLGSSFWVHEQIGPIAILLLILCAPGIQCQRVPAAIAALSLIASNAALIYFTRESNARLSGETAGSLSYISSHLRFLADMVQTTPIGSLYYTTSGLTNSALKHLAYVLCGVVMAAAAISSPSTQTKDGLSGLIFPVMISLLAAGAYIVSLLPVLMSAFPWHTGRVIYIPFVAFTLCCCSLTEIFVRISDCFRYAVYPLIAGIIAWGGLSLNAESVAFDRQIRINYERAASLREAVGRDNLFQGKTALVVGGFPYGDNDRPLFGEHFIGLTLAAVKVAFGMRISGSPVYPALHISAGSDHLCKRSNLMGSILDPPPLKWSALKYVFWHQGGPICRGSITSLKRSSPSCGRWTFWSHRARTLPTRSARSA